jgi:Domain of unknown function (DUF4258)
MALFQRSSCVALILREATYSCPMQGIVLSAHAEAVMASRTIPMAWIERVLSDPDRKEPDRLDAEFMHGLKRIPEHGDRVLRVVYTESANAIRNVTVYFDRTMRNKL